MHPHALQLSSLPPLSEGERWKLSRGSLVFSCGHRIVLSSVKTVDLTATITRVPQHILHGVAEVVERGAIKSDLHIAHLRERQAYEAGMEQKIDEFLHHVERVDYDRALRLGADLLGMGAGLTPAFDDFTVGLIGSCTWGGQEYFNARRPLFKELVSLAPQLTTRVSCGFLQSAVEGMFASPILALLKAVTAANPAVTRSAVAEVLAMGSSSGADSLAGVHAGIRALAP